MITSIANPLVKEIVRLRKKGRAVGEPIIIEGEKEIFLAVRAGFRIDKSIYCLDYYQGDARKLPGEPVEVDRKVFDKIAYREHPDGILALAEPRNIKLADLKLRANPFFIILEAVEKPGNLGAVLRTADAVGVDAVIVCDPKTDIYNSNVIRASVGAIFTVPVVVIDTDKAIDYLRSKSIKVFAAVVGAERNIWQADFTGPAALVIGAEHQGLSKKWKRAADEKVAIPMYGQVDSLNASVSAAIMMYETLRQRNVRY